MQPAQGVLIFGNIPVIATGPFYQPVAAIFHMPVDFQTVGQVVLDEESVAIVIVGYENGVEAVHEAERL